jgi:hypothetical protein
MNLVNKREERKDLLMLCISCNVSNIVNVNVPVHVNVNESQQQRWNRQRKL